MNLRDTEKLEYYTRKIREVANNLHILGLNSEERICTLARQCLDSEKRIKYVQVISEKDLNDSVLDPNSIGFDAIKASCLLNNKGLYDEAVWMCFLGTFFGKHKSRNWRSVKAIYGMLGERTLTWEYITQNVDKVREWLREKEDDLRNEVKFSNHRKFVSISDAHTGRAFSSYVNWIGEDGHERKFSNIINEVGEVPKVLFERMYKEVGAIHQFGRMGKFDFLCMMGKSRLLNIEPAHGYLAGATGPVNGLADLLRNSPTDQVSRDRMEDFMEVMAEALDNQYYIMQILEDAICNWQKSPTTYTYFSG